MFQTLLPDYMFREYTEITPEFLEKIGVDALLIDIDNTLAPYEQPDPDSRVKQWVLALQAHNIRLAIVSNNHKERVTRYALPLGIPFFFDSHKPGKRTLQKALDAVGAPLSRTAVLGDQLLTDAAFGKRHGMRAIIVPPIYDKRNLFFRLKRLLEIPVIRQYNRLHNTSFDTFTLPPASRLEEFLNHQNTTERQ